MEFSEEINFIELYDDGDLEIEINMTLKLRSKYSDPLLISCQLCRIIIWSLIKTIECKQGLYIELNDPGGPE